jgi:hypothetical protein
LQQDLRNKERVMIKKKKSRIRRNNSKLKRIRSSSYF